MSTSHSPPASLRWIVLSAAVSLVSISATFAGERIRWYEGGESDFNPMVGGSIFDTTDNQIPPVLGSDAAGDSVPLVAEFFENEPTYVLGRGGANTLAIDFDGLDDRLTSDGFDPRNFGSFSALSQAWVLPDSAKMGTDQFVWSLGNDNGGVGISAAGNWTVIASNIVADFETTVPVLFDDWTHVAIRRTGNFVQLYLNGSLAANGDGFWNGPGAVTLGNRTTGGMDENSFDGVIDDFSLYGFSTPFDVANDIEFFSEFVPTDIQGDVDQDGDADQDDYTIWVANYGFDNGFGAGDPATLLIGDLDDNGRVNFFDLNEIVQGARAQGNALSIGIPEPSSVTLIVLSCMLFGLVARRRRPVATLLWIAAAIALFTSSTAPMVQAEVIVADDFHYAQPTKALGPGGGFRDQDYGGGQSGPAGAWIGRWASVGNGIITGTDHEVVEEHHQALVTTGLSLAEINRGFSLNGLNDSQPIYFGIDLRTGAELEIPTALFNINPVETMAGIGIGYSEETFIARLGETTGLGFDFTNDALFHRLVGKLEINASGADERLTVWLDPSGVEIGVDSTSVEADVIGGVNDLAGNLELWLDIENAGSPTWWDNLAVGTNWEDAAAVDIPRMSLIINEQSGNARLENETGSEFSFNFLEYQADRSVFTVDEMQTLADQGVDGAAWQEVLTEAAHIVESRFDGTTTLAAGESINLGRLVRSTSGSGLVGRIGNDEGLLNLLDIKIIDEVEMLDGDYDGDNFIGQGDLDLVLLSWGGPAVNGWTTDLPNGNVDQEELDKVLLGWGQSGASLAGAAAVPEPGSGMLLLHVLGITFSLQIIQQRRR